MSSRRFWGLAAPVLGVIAGLVCSTSPASAATASFGCRASLARVSLLNGTATVEPYVANPVDDPCADGNDGLSVGTVLNLGPLSTPLGPILGGSIQIGPAQATTTAPNDDPTTGASAAVNVSALSIPTVLDGTISIVGPATASASYACVNGAAVASGGSTLTALQIAGQTITLPPNGVPDTITLPQGLGTISVNENIQTATSDTERMLEFQLAGLADVVVGEAAVDAPATGACAGTTGGGGGGTGGGGGGGTGGGGSGGGTGSGGGGSGSGGTGGTGTSSGAPVNTAAGSTGTAGAAHGVSGPGAPKVKGKAIIGHTLTVTPGQWDGAHPITYSYQWNRAGKAITRATGRRYRVKDADGGRDLSVTVTATNPDGSVAVTTKGTRVRYPAGCPAATGKISASKVGRVRLGITPKQARSAFRKSNRRHLHRYEDSFCFTPNPVRVGYASPKALTGTSARSHKKLADRVIMVLTSNKHYAVKDVRSGTALSTARRHLRLSRGYRVGKNVWYFARNGRTELLLKAPGKKVQEIGIVNRSLTRTRAQRNRFLCSFYS